MDTNFTSTLSTSKVCKSALGICYTSIIDGGIVRGCVGDKLFPDTESIERCYAGLQCSICKESKCNRIPASDTCIRCSSSDPDSACRKNPGLDLKSVCTLSEKFKMGCYLNVSGETYTRGCLKDLNFNDRSTCTDNSNTCKSCNTPNCNRKADFKMKCYHCHGNEDADCAQAHDMAEVSCNNYEKTCVTGINAFGFTQRDCVHDTYYEQFERCYTDRCNGQIYPEDRNRCFQCAGEYSCENLMDGTEPVVAKACKHEHDKCYAYLGKGENYLLNFFLLKFSIFKRWISVIIH